MRHASAARRISSLVAFFDRSASERASLATSSPILFNFSGDDEKETAIMALSSYLREKDTGQVRIVREIAEKIEHYGKSEK